MEVKRSMSELASELNASRKRYNQKLNTLKKMKVELGSITKSDEQWPSGIAAYKAAKAEFNSSKMQMELLFDRIKQDHTEHKNISHIHPATASKRHEGMDHFSAALNRVDPQLRLQLFK
jgi:hypothetical protein